MTVEIEIKLACVKSCGSIKEFVVSIRFNFFKLCRGNINFRAVLYDMPYIEK
jgi:hypothetical protein